MDKAKLVRKLYAYKQDPELYKEPTFGELADLVIFVLDQVNVIDKSIREGRLDGKTPEPDKDYLSKDSAIQMLTQAVNSKLSELDNALASKTNTVETQVREIVTRVRDGRDGIVTEAEIERAATIASSLIQLPDFEMMLTEAIQGNGTLLRDALESLPKGEEQLNQEAIQNLPEDLQKIRDMVANISVKSGGGIGKRQVYEFIRQAIADGTISAGGSSLTVEEVDGSPSVIEVNKIKFPNGTITDNGSGVVTFDPGSLGGGDMNTVTYDPQAIGGDAFDTDNHTDGTTNKVYTATEKTKLAGIEASADVTDTVNVTAAGALMDSEVTNLAQVKAFSSADYATAAQGTLASSAVQPGDNISDLVNDAGYITSASVSDGDKGDITVSGSGATWTIDNGAVTLAKQADMATASVVYRKTAGTGAPEVQTLATLKTDLGLTGTNSGDQTTITGNAGTATALQTARTINGTSFDGTANITVTAAGSTLSDTVTVAKGGTGRTTGTTAYSLVATGTTATGAQQTLANGATTDILVGGGASALPVWTTATGSGAPVRATSPTLVTPNLGTPSAVTLTNATGYPAATTSASGIAEASIASEVNTGTDAARYVSPDSLAGSNFGIRYVAVTLNGSTALTTSDKAYYRIPAALTGMNLVSVSATVGTGAAGSSSSGTPTFTVKNVTDSNQMLSTSLTVDASEYTSATAAVAAVINASFDDVVTDDLIEVACTTAGTGVTFCTITMGFALP